MSSERRKHGKPNSGITRLFWGANAQGLFQNAQGLFSGVRNAFKPKYS